MTRLNRITVGMDLSDRQADVCAFDGETVMLEKQVSLTKVSLSSWFDDYRECRVVLEVGTHSPWVSRLLEEMGLRYSWPTRCIFE